MTDPLPSVHDFDDRVIGEWPDTWPVEVPPFRDERHQSLWHRVQYLAMRAAQRGTLVLPGWAREGITRAVAGTARRLDRRHREAALEFVASALPDASPEEVRSIARAAWRHLVRVALVSEGITNRVRGRRLGDHYDVRMADDVRATLERGEGAIMVTAHAGYWEAACPGIVAIGFQPAYAVGKAPKNDFVARHIQRMRESQGMRLIPRRGAMTAVPSAVRGGGFVGMLLDHRPRKKPVIAPFFGRPAACDRSAGVLIRRVGAPLVFYGCYGAEGADPLRDWRFELRFTRVIEPEVLSGLDPVEIATRVNQELETLILHRPREVFWLHDRYKGMPAPAPPSAPLTGPA